MSEDKVERQLQRIRERADALSGNQHMMLILHDAVIALDRVRGRLATPEGYERVEIAQNRGPRIEFTGRLLCEAEAGNATLELWETQAGAWVAVTFLEPHGDREIATATVVPPGEDYNARTFAVMDHWGWEDRARSMVRKLGWTLREDVA